MRAEGVGNGAANGVRDEARARGPALCAAAGEEMGVHEDEGHRAPEAAPARREHGGAGAVLSGEAGDNAAEEVVGEAADAVDSIAFLGVSGGAGQGGGNRDRRLGEETVDEVEHHFLVDVKRPRIQPVSHQSGRCVIHSSVLACAPDGGQHM